MWRALVAAIAACWVIAASAQAPVPVTFAWDLDPTHDQVTVWEAEADGSILPCASPQVTATDRRCTIQIAPGTYTFRLRASTGPWSAPLEGTITSEGDPPGSFIVTFHRESELSVAEQYWYPGSGLGEGSFTSGPTTSGWAPHTFNYGNVITVGGAAGTATVISARVDTGNFGAIDLKLGLYDGSNNLLAQGLLTVPNGTTGTWRDISISVAVSPGTYYVLGSASTTNLRYYYNTGISGKFASNNYAASMADPSGTIGDDPGLGYAVRVFVVESAGGANILRQMMNYH